VNGSGRSTIELDASRNGAVLVDVALEDPVSGQTLGTLPDAAVVDVVPRAAVLYAQGFSGALARSLRKGGWMLEWFRFAARRPRRRAGWYQSIVLDDVAIADASPRFWKALVAAVQKRGLGLMVLGGERSFARGGYRDSALESVLPVLSEPPALDQPASILFVVDKSGSMGQGSGGVDRFQLAQRAVLETARGLTERDSLGLVVFDVAPRVLILLGPALSGRQRCSGIGMQPEWRNAARTRARGCNCRAQSLRSGARRMLVLVTDGFIDDASLAELRARLERARIETIALAVGPDADANALERLVGAEAGVVLRVNEAAECRSSCAPASSAAARASSAGPSR
jgi:hypothetical protein